MATEKKRLKTNVAKATAKKHCPDCGGEHEFYQTECPLKSRFVKLQQRCDRLQNRCDKFTTVVSLLANTERIEKILELVKKFEKEAGVK